LQTFEKLLKIQKRRKKRAAYSGNTLTELFPGLFVKGDPKTVSHE